MVRMQVRILGMRMMRFKLTVTCGYALATGTKNYQEAEKEVQKRRNKQEPPKKLPGTGRG